jgi:hypothetical protein
MNQYAAGEGTTIRHRRYVGRVAGLAVTLGIGVGLATTPWMASAAPSSASANAPGQNHSVSTQGVVREQHGSATASSIDAPGSVAIATGANSRAFSDCPHCKAEVNGTSSTGFASGTSNNTVIIRGNNDTAQTLDGSGNTATINGNRDFATAIGSNNSVTVNGNNSQAAAETPGSGPVTGSTVRVTGDNLGPVIADGNNQTVIVPPKG